MDTTAVPEATRQSASQWLSDSERKRMAAIALPRRRDEFLAARYAMRLGMAHAHGESNWHNWLLSSQENHGPTVLRGPVSHSGHLPCLSLSHSCGLIAVGISHGPLGIDLEVQGRSRPYSELLELMGSVQERQRFETLPAAMRPAEFYRIWTLKEACFKREGTGLDWARIRRLHTDPQASPRNNAPAGAIWQGWHRTLPYTLALCATDRVSPACLTLLSTLKAPEFVGLWRFVDIEHDTPAS